MNDLAQRRKQLAETLMRDSIWEAAASVLAEVGFANLTMDRVAQAADVSKGTLYNYFRDRDSLVLEVAENMLRPLQAEIDELFETYSEAAQVLLEVVDVILSHVEGDLGLGKVFCEGDLPELVEARFRSNHLRLLSQFTGVFERAANNGLLREDCTEPAKAAHLLLASLHGLIEGRVLHPEDCPPLNEELDFLTQFMINPWFKETE
jgi:AcrR family transcriptional regulator